MFGVLKALSLAGRLILLTVILVLASALGAQLLPDAGPLPPEEAAGPALGLVLALLFLQTLALGFLILRSRWRGLRLTLTIGVLFFGSATFLTQIESLVYLRDQLPPGMLAGLFAMGLINAVVLSPLAVWVLGKGSRRGAGAVPAPAAAANSRRPWARLAVAALVFLALYYLCGYYIAWQSPAVREFYGGSDPGSFVAQMLSVARDTPWMLPFQYLRGLVWAALAWLVVRSTRGGWWEAGLGAALLFTVPALFLLLPNPLMPEPVRLAHLVETAPYQFLFGWFAAWWLRDRRGVTVVRDLATASGTSGEAAPATGAGAAG